MMKEFDDNIPARAFDNFQVGDTDLWLFLTSTVTLFMYLLVFLVLKLNDIAIFFFSL